MTISQQRAPATLASNVEAGRPVDYAQMGGKKYAARKSARRFLFVEAKVRRKLLISVLRAILRVAFLAELVLAIGLSSALALRGGNLPPLATVNCRKVQRDKNTLLLRGL